METPPASPAPGRRPPGAGHARRESVDPLERAATHRTSSVSHSPRGPSQARRARVRTRPPPARPPVRRGPGPRQQFQARAPSPGRNGQSSELGDFAVRSLTSPEALLSARQASFAAPEELPGERRVPVRLDGGGWSPRDTPRTRKGSPGGAR